MLLDEFINKYDLANEKELLRVLYMAFYHLKHADVRSFSYDDIVEWFGSQNWSKPNRTRLIKNLKDCKFFIKGDGSNTFKLHGKKISELEVKFEEFDFSEVFLKINTKSGEYIDGKRLSELKHVNSQKYDLKKLIEICEELNTCIKTNCVLAIGALVRMLIDHVPPIFGCASFGEVSNNYAGAKSFKQSMRNLENSSRKISDRLIHTQIRSSETLPTITQIDFTNDIDVLLEEIVRLLK